MKKNINNTKDKNLVKLAFASTNQYWEENVPENVSLEIKGKDFVAWGNDNQFPQFLYDLYKNCSTLQSIVNGTIDFVLGDEIISNLNDDREHIENICKDYLLYGVSYINVLRNALNEVTSISVLDAKNVRTNKDNTVFYYSKNWSKSYGRVDCIVLPIFSPNSTDKSSVIMLKKNDRDTYPTPIYAPSIKSIMTDLEISKYHLNEILNNFSASAIINFNNGQPDDESKYEIEELISEKFCGSENSGRFLLAFNDNKDNAVTVERLNTDDFDERYNAVYKKVRQDIFTAFRANPNLFGIPTENLGFSSEEYESSFKIYNKIMVQGIQKKIIDILSKIGYTVEIKPFNLNNNETID